MHLVPRGKLSEIHNEERSTADYPSRPLKWWHSYLHASALRTPRWDDHGVQHYFYKSADAAHEAVHQLMSEVAKDPEHM